MERLKVLLLPVRDLYSPWCENIKAAIGDRHDLEELDDDLPIAVSYTHLTLPTILLV